MSRVTLKTAKQIESLKAAGAIHREVMGQLCAAADAGMTTHELDQLAEKSIQAFGAKPSFKGYRGFPACICTSINQEIVHGIPSDQRVLADGDLLKLDLGVFYEGMHADAGRTVEIGQVSDADHRLAESAREAFEAGIKDVRAGQALNQIGKRIQALAEGRGYGVVRELIGHGVGAELHEEPEVPNFFRPDLRVTLQPGMVLAVEPMLNAGTHRIKHLDDGWTIETADGQQSSYYENTIVITETGIEIVT